MAPIIKAMTSSPDGTLWPHIGGLLAIAVGLVDLWHFRAFPDGLAVTLILAGFAAAGLNVAFNIGKAART